MDIDSFADAVFLFVAVLLLIVLPIATLFVFARMRGRSAVHSLWGVLSWFGVIIGMLVMSATRPRGD